MNILTKLTLTLLLALPLTVAAAQRPATPFTDAEIDQMLAPIALYPDTVLSHVLIAATVPDEVEDAADWIERHPDLRGQAAVDAVERFDWDPSVQALVAFPEVLERMSEDPDWTEALGLAFLEQEDVVMDRVQYLRDRAYENGSLEELEHVRVVREREYIYLEPAVSRVVYVPYYDPYFVYGHWWWPAYPPHRWTFWAGYPVRHYYGSTFWWGVNFHIGPTWYVNRFNWHDRHIAVSRPNRHCAPSPCYAGRSLGRHDTVRHDSRRWRSDPPGRRAGTPVGRGHDRHDDGDTHVPQGRRQARRSWSDVQAALVARRNDPTRHDAGDRAGGNVRAHRSDGVTRTDGWFRRDESRARGDVRRQERARSDTRPQSPRAEPHERRSAPAVWARPERHSQRHAVERAPERGAERSARPEVRSESRVESRSRSEGRSESRSAGRGNGGNRVRSR